MYREFSHLKRLSLSLNGVFCVLFLSVVIMEPNLDDPGFVSPLDPDPSPRAPVAYFLLDLHRPRKAPSMFAGSACIATGG